MLNTNSAHPLALHMFNWTEGCTQNKEQRREKLCHGGTLRKLSHQPCSDLIPRLVGGERAAWHKLLAHAWPFPVYFHTCLCGLSTWIMCEQNFQAWIDTPPKRQKSRSGVQLKHSTALLSNVGLKQDWPSCLCDYIFCLMTEVMIKQHINLPLLLCRQYREAWIQSLSS